jgi:hypothetical protein
MLPVIVAAVMASASLGSMPAYHRHAIATAQDAISTARAVWFQRFPQSGVDKEDWQKEFRATREGNVWFIRQIMATPNDNRGTYIYLDAKDGHIISANIVD